MALPIRLRNASVPCPVCPCPMHWTSGPFPCPGQAILSRVSPAGAESPEAIELWAENPWLHWDKNWGLELRPSSLRAPKKNNLPGALLSLIPRPRVRRPRLYKAPTWSAASPPSSWQRGRAQKPYKHMVVGQNPVPLVNIKVGDTWVFIRFKMGSA